MVETKQIRCRNCDGVLFTESLPEEPEGELLDSSFMPHNVQDDGTSRFLRCPQCSAKNLIASGIHPNDTPFFRITGIVMDDL